MRFEPDNMSSREPLEATPSRRRLLGLAVIALSGLGLAACGLKGEPELPADATRRTPRQYPAR